MINKYRLNYSTLIFILYSLTYYNEKPRPREKVVSTKFILDISMNNYHLVNADIGIRIRFTTNHLNSYVDEFAIVHEGNHFKRMQNFRVLT